MPARDLYHSQVRNALIKDGWTITHDPLRINWGRKEAFVDLGAERILAAEKHEQRIAVEVKSFIGASDMQDLEHALGQFTLYRSILKRREPDRQLYLAVPYLIIQTIFEQPIGDILFEDELVYVLGFDPATEEVVQWLPTMPTAES
jgi:XisH protein